MKCLVLEILNRAACKPIKSSTWRHLSFSPNPNRDFLKKNKKLITSTMNSIPVACRSSLLL